MKSDPICVTFLASEIRLARGKARWFSSRKEDFLMGENIKRWLDPLHLSHQHPSSYQTSWNPSKLLRISQPTNSFSSAMFPFTFLMLAALLLLTPTSTLAKLSLGATTVKFGVCAAQTVTNSGPTTIDGLLGLSPGTSVTGFPPGKATKIEVGSAAAIECESQAAKTYATCVGLPTTKDLSGQPLGGRTLPSGVYNFATTASLNGELRLDAKLKPNAQFIFKIGTGLTTAARSKVVLIGLAKGCNVFFCVGSSATIGADNVLQGALIAYTSVSVFERTSLVGGFYALNGQVTLLENKITKTGSCTGLLWENWVVILLDLDLFHSFLSFFNFFTLQMESCLSGRWSVVGHSFVLVLRVSH